MLDRNADTVVSSVGPPSPGSAKRKVPAWPSEAEQPTAKASAEPKLLDRLAQALRSRHYSRRTEQTYCHWVKRYIFFHKVRHPAEMAEAEINAFLTHLAVKEKVAASTQNQALSALLFLYRHVLNREVGDLGERHVPYFPAFLRHATPGKRLRHQNRAGTHGPQGREDHHDLYPCPEPGRQGRQEPRGRFVKEKRRCLIQKPYIPPRSLQNMA